MRLRLKFGNIYVYKLHFVPVSLICAVLRYCYTYASAAEFNNSVHTHTHVNLYHENISPQNLLGALSLGCFQVHVYALFANTRDKLCEKLHAPVRFDVFRIA